MHTICDFKCIFAVFILNMFFPYSSGLLYWHPTIAPAPVMQPWRVWVYVSQESTSWWWWCWMAAGTQSHQPGLPDGMATSYTEHNSQQLWSAHCLVTAQWTLGTTADFYMIHRKKLYGIMWYMQQKDGTKWAHFSNVNVKTSVRFIGAMTIGILTVIWVPVVGGYHLICRFDS